MPKINIKIKYQIGNLSLNKNNYEAIVLGRGPLGVFTCTNLLLQGYSVLNIDTGINLNNLRKKIIVDSNIEWKSKNEPPSLNVEASSFMWTGGCMGWPLGSLGNNLDQIPIKKEDFINSIKSITKYLNINDFDFTNNKPLDFNNQLSNSMTYTYLMQDYGFKDKIQSLENNKNYKFIDNATSFEIIPGDENEVLFIQDGNKLSYSSSKLFLCLGAIENTRVFLNSTKLSKLKYSDGLEIEDHLRFPIAKFKISNLYKFKKLFDKTKNSKNQKYLWPRFTYEGFNKESYTFFRFWRYDNLFFRKFKINFLKKRIFNSGTCELYLYVEKEKNKISIESESKEIKNIKVSFNLDQEEISNINELVSLYINKYKENFGDLIIDTEIYTIDLKKDFLRTVESASHPSGMLKMGTNKESSFVNKYSQLWDFTNIYIFGSAVLPRPHYIHPTFPCLVLADYSLNNLSS